MTSGPRTSRIKFRLLPSCFELNPICDLDRHPHIAKYMFVCFFASISPCKFWWRLFHAYRNKTEIVKNRTVSSSLHISIYL